MKITKGGEDGCQGIATVLHTLIVNTASNASALKVTRHVPLLTLRCLTCLASILA